MAKWNRKAIAPNQGVGGALTYTLPAPYMGLNSLDAISSMDPAYALQMVNLIPTPQGPTLVNGCRNFVTGITGQWSSLLVYNGLNGQKMFGNVAGTMYDVSAVSTGPSSVITGLSTSNVTWISTNFATLGANYLVACNGADATRYYNGAAWAAMTASGTFAAPPATIGAVSATDSAGATVDPSKWIDCFVHQDRLWFIPANQNYLHYLPIGSLGGAVSQLPMSSLLPRGGTIQDAASWSVDTGLGIQNYLVVLSSKGDTLIWSGNNPSFAATWTMTGYWQLGAPVAGQQSLEQYSGDLLTLTQDGLVPLSKYLQSTRVDTSDALTYKIQPTISAFTTAYANLAGWRMIVYPGNNMMVVNVPQPATGGSKQYLYNTITKGWGERQGWNANCWALYNNQLYFGGTNSIQTAFVGYADYANSDGTGGNNIVATVQSAYTGLDPASGIREKQVTAFRPNFISGTSAPSISGGIAVDYSLVPVLGSGTIPIPSTGTWDTTNWDSGSAVWAGGLLTYNKWLQPQAPAGFVVSTTLSISAPTFLQWTSTDYLYLTGGVIG